MYEKAMIFRFPSSYLTVFRVVWSVYGGETVLGSNQIFGVVFPCYYLVRA